MMNNELKFKLDHELKGSIRRLDLIYEYFRQWIRDEDQRSMSLEALLDKDRVMLDMENCLAETAVNWQRMKKVITAMDVLDIRHASEVSIDQELGRR